MPSSTQYFIPTLNTYWQCGDTLKHKINSLLYHHIIFMPYASSFFLSSSRECLVVWMKFWESIMLQRVRVIKTSKCKMCDKSCNIMLLLIAIRFLSFFSVSVCFFRHIPKGCKSWFWFKFHTFLLPLRKKIKAMTLQSEQHTIIKMIQEELFRRLESKKKQKKCNYDNFAHLLCFSQLLHFFFSCEKKSIKTGNKIC
jgi:hypothetical protein